MKHAIPILNRFWKYLYPKKDWRRAKYPHFALTRELESEFQTKDRYINSNIRKNSTSSRDIQYRRLTNNHISIRLESSFLAAQTRKIEYRHPFFDVKLIEYYYSLPSEFKYWNGIGRYLYRKAMEGILPELILGRHIKSGNTVPNFQYRFQKDQSGFLNLIDESRQNNAFHFVDYQKLINLSNLIMEKDIKRNRGIGGRAFINAISILLLQKWQREGKIDIGIKC
jgi:asparagine synthetase B (glutamine-hydrolysing)